MKKILFVVDEFLPIASAPAVRINSFIDELQDFDVHVVGGVAGKRKRRGTKLHRVQQADMGNFLGYAMFLAKMNLKTIWKTLTVRPDVTVISMPKYELLWSAPFAKLFSKKLVLDLRDSFEFLDYEKYFKHFLPGFIAVPFGKLVVLLTRANFFLSTSIANMITVANPGIYYTLRRRSEVVLNGVDTDTFKPKKRKITKKLNLVYMGNFAEKDQFDLIYKVLPKFKDRILLNLIGGGRNKYKVVSELKRLDIPYKDHGFVQHKKLPDVLNKMHIGFIFREKDVKASVPVSIFEYTSLNIPTLTNAVGLMWRFVRVNNVGYITSTPQSLEKALKKFIQNPKHFDKFSGLHKFAKENLTRKERAKKFRDLIRYLVAE